MRSRNPTGWMWAQACDLLDQAEQMHRQFFRLAASGRTRAVWEPPVDMFEDEREILIIVALPGVPAERIEVRAEAGALLVCAERRIPEAGAQRVVRRLEIPYGHFERRIPLPAVEFETAAREFSDGCLILRLHKAEQS
jgi:HSP20 family protein